MYNVTVLRFPASLLTLVVLSPALQISVVAQEPVLFGRSIRENIKYGTADATDEDMYDAAKLANAHRFITSDFPNGYDTGEWKRTRCLSVQSASCFLSTDEKFQPLIVF